MAALAFIINWIWQTFFFNIVSFATKWQNVFFLKGKTLSQSLPVSEREDDSCLYVSVGYSLPGLSASHALGSLRFMGIDLGCRN